MKRQILSILAILAVVFVITACEKQPDTVPNVTLQGAVISSGNTTTTLNQTVLDLKNVTSDNKTSQNTSAAEPDYSKVSYTIKGTEGDLISLKLQAVDPDGDKLTYKYSAPFNENGKWQTKDGDAGKYLSTITVTDGKTTASTDILIVINPSNKAPIVDCPEEIKVKEGDTVNLNCNFFDKENDPIKVEYSGWMTSPVYTTGYESQGSHQVFVRVSDATHNITKTIIVNVENVNRAPKFDVHMKDLTIVESDIVTLKPEASDPDGDTLKITYSTPIDGKGVWKTKVGDAGTYPVSVVVSDGSLTTKETFTLTVKMLNTAPVMKFIPNVNVDEGDTVKIVTDVADRENDPITIKYSGWMTTSTYTTTYDDAYPKGCDESACSATYKVTVTASDGVYTASQDVFVTVNDKNRPPVFVMP